MKIYEIMYILDQDLKDTKSLETKIENIIINNGGEILEKSSWGLMKFAYKINKKEKGYYFVIIAKTTSENVDEFKRISKIEQGVVRTFVLNTEKEKHYEASTKLSKTEVKNDRFERKTIGKKYKRKTFDNVNENDVKDANSSEQNNFSKPTAEIKTVKKNNEKNVKEGDKIVK
ncbi:30S ribosomal protein S6 [Spiroplasma endosymbiont of Amphibalanus improvisus]|uniref:30S ribosomal protein S6 n=1 Tax=Spiroplasma endosymbiont of Amphibalanus improvisus TaxID=3066327 RepID=UPI00313D8212